MNYYVTVEGISTEIEIYKCWIKYLNPSLKYIDSIEQYSENKYFIIGGGGYPKYFDIIANAIDDVNNNDKIDKLVVSVDSEEMTYLEKLNEITEFINNKVCNKPVSIIIQHFCFETWALGNRKIFSPNMSLPNLIDFMNFYNVRINDPEYLPKFTPRGWNRSQFAMHYLKSGINNKYRKITYRKNNPGPITHKKYFDEIQKRLNDTDHIQSFNNFINAFG